MSPCPPSSRAHPRSRGENTAYMRADHPELGSSPLTRGKPTGCPRSWTRTGLIPAHAGKTIRRNYTPGGCLAHPRSRGENSVSGPPAWKARGSSPLTRGKQRRRQVRAQRAGLIPAHAGKTIPLRGRAPLPRAHPRSRGENSTSARKAPIKTGSSPLTRGKLRAHRVPETRLGLIPAHAGKTTHAVATSGSRRAHPRSRGENWTVRSPVSRLRGSSPLTRGKLGDGTIHGHGCGLIPAHAGKT